MSKIVLSLLVASVLGMPASAGVIPGPGACPRAVVERQMFEQYSGSPLRAISTRQRHDRVDRFPGISLDVSREGIGAYLEQFEPGSRVWRRISDLNRIPFTNAQGEPSFARLINFNGQGELVYVSPNGRVTQTLLERSLPVKFGDEPETLRRGTLWKAYVSTTNENEFLFVADFFTTRRGFLTYHVSRLD